MPRSGPCNPWISGADVLALPWVQAAIAKNATGKDAVTLSDTQQSAIAAEAAAAASETLYNLSGKVLTGRCGPITIRPLARPTNVDSRTWLGDGGAWGDYGGGVGSVAWYGLGASGVITHFGDSSPPELPLPDYPVLEISEVTINGIAIPSNEYELRDHRVLVRLRPTASSTPTAEYGWPTAQINDLPNSQDGTFAVTYVYGQDPGAMGRLACKKLAEYLALPSFGDTTHYPQRVTSVTRQGVSAMVTDVMDIIKAKQLGIYEVDTFLLSVNPTKATRQSVVWSPDTGRQRRQQRPSPSI